MLVTSAGRSAASRVSSTTGFPTIGATSPVIRGGLPRFVVRQRRQSSSKHSSPAAQQPAPVASAPKQQNGKKSDASSSANSSSSNNGSSNSTASSARESKPRRGNARNHASAKDRLASENPHKTTDAIVADVHAQLDSVAMPPSVPSTSHYDPKIVHLASLFAQHRPISLHQPVPPQESRKAFESLFAGAADQKKSSQDVIFTLSSAVKSLEMASNGAPSSSPNKIVTPSPFDQASPHNAANQQRAQSINLEELAKQFRPFNVPPAPVPMDPKYLQQSQQQQQQRRRQPSKKSGQKKQASPDATQAVAKPPMPEGVVAEITGEPANVSRAVLASFRKRMQARQIVWQLISVKRQRKLKMKKHKYKKLMRKTRNLRRRQDRL